MAAPTPPDDVPQTLAGAVAKGGALMLRDTLLNGGVLLSLIVGVGGVLDGDQPWVWLGPLLGVIGVVVSFAAHRERVVTTAAGEQRRTLLPGPAIWLTAVLVPLAAIAAMAAMWGRSG